MYLHAGRQAGRHVCTFVCMYFCMHACMHACMHVGCKSSCRTARAVYNWLSPDVLGFAKPLVIRLGCGFRVHVKDRFQGFETLEFMAGD